MALLRERGGFESDTAFIGVIFGVTLGVELGDAFLAAAEAFSLVLMLSVTLLSASGASCTAASNEYQLEFNARQCPWHESKEKAYQ